MKNHVIILFLLTITHHYIWAQSDKEDVTSSELNEAFAIAVKFYNNTIGNNSMIFTGSYYNESYWGINGHPFFMNNNWEAGIIMYEGQQYDSLEIKYDIYSDLLIVKYVDKRDYVIPIQLNSIKVEEFTVMGHHFIRIEEDSLSDIKSGFFDLLHDGEKVKVLAKRRKEIKRTQELNVLVKTYIVKDKYYIKSDQYYYEINGKKSILEVLSDRKNEIKVFLKKNKARFRKDSERQLIEAVQYYNSIVNNKGS